MAKRYYTQGGKINNRGHGKFIKEDRAFAINNDIHHKNRSHEKTLGIKQSVLEVYRKEGLLAAYQKLRAYNQKIGSEVYTREIFENWIAEENKRNKGQENKDGCDR